MHPYIHFTALPIAVTAAWFAASHWTDNDPGRYRLPSVPQLEDPSASALVRPQVDETTDIKVSAFLPQVPPRPEKPEPTLVLHSVMTGSDVNFATINGQVLREGDSVDGYLVRHIGADGVELAHGNSVRRLPMRPLHELPPPVQPGTDPALKESPTGQQETALNRNFWATFDSPQP